MSESAPAPQPLFPVPRGPVPHAPAEPTPRQIDIRIDGKAVSGARRVNDPPRRAGVGHRHAHAVLPGELDAGECVPGLRR